MYLSFREDAYLRPRQVKGGWMQTQAGGRKTKVKKGEKKEILSQV